MQLFHFLVVITSLSCGSLPAADSGVTRPLLATTALVGLWSMLAHLGSRMIAKQVAIDELDPHMGARWLEKQLEIFRWMSLLVIVLCLAGFGLARTLDSIPVLMDSMLLQSIVLLAPGLIMTVATWSAEHRYGVQLGYTQPGLSNHVGSLWLSFRSGLAWLVAPVVLLLGISDLIALLPITPAVAGWSTAAVVLFFIVLGLPLLIRRLFKTEPIDTETQRWMEELMLAAGVKGTKPIRWNTGQTAFNAMVAGFVARWRTLLLSDRLLDQLPRDQIAMVVLHEAAHLRRKHVPMRMLAVLPAWIAGMLVSQIAGESTWAMPLGTVAGILLTMLILRIVAYRSEFDADVQACMLAEKIAATVDDVPSSYDAACESLSAALMRVTSDQPASRKPTWLHPGVTDRVDWMRRHRAMPHNNTASAGTIANPA
ncbi:MAG: M48 family metalloprotease [Pirellulaceae bacterium]|nr:M48 family metalloprotease [Pirellulaceae bacterium]